MTLGSTRRVLGVLSLYEGFFAGGARQLHSTVVAGLHASGRQRHAALSIYETVRREATLQYLVDDQRYQLLRSAGVPVSTLGRSSDDGLDPRVFTEAELDAVAAQVRASDVVMSLKEQPLRLVNELPDLGRPVVACLHRSDPEHQGAALDDLLLAADSGRLAAVICCAESTREAYRAAGVPGSLLHVVPNGIDLARFRPVPGAARRELRASLLGTAVPDDAGVVAFAARFDTMKNPGLFVAAARHYLERDLAGHVVLCGAGMSAENPNLDAELTLAFGDRPDLLPRVHALGVRGDMELVYAAADVVALTSAFGEAAPLCLIEGAMCGAVPVTTPVGDSARIVAGIGFVTGFEADEIAETWIEATARRAELTPALVAARSRFSHVRMLAGYASILDRVAAPAWA